MAGKTISFCKGKGSLNHNNRVFISENVHEERIPWNRTYKKETLEEAYEKCFGEAVREYNAGQKRNDRKIENYLKKIKFSNNKEKLFYENVVQLGDRHDTPVVDTDGNLTTEAKEAIEMLEEYLKTFSERNPNLYIFNCVLHLDESTPHIHFDYIPVAQGYKTGMKKRNSLSKAFQQMGIAKGKGQFENEAIYWEAREREYLMGLCRERGIEVVIKGDKRDNLILPEYKAAMRKVEGLEQEADRLEEENGKLQQTASDLSGQVQEMQEEKAALSEQRAELAEQAQELKADIAVKEQECRKIDEKLGSLKSKKKEIERNVHVYEDDPKWQLTEPSLLMSAKDYRAKVALPLVQKLKKVVFDLTFRCIDALESVKKYKTKANDLQRDVNSLSKKVHEQADTISDLRTKEQALEDVREHFGADKIEEIKQAAEQRRRMERLKLNRPKNRGIAI